MKAVSATAAVMFVMGAMSPSRHPEGQRIDGTRAVDPRQ
jgi:hypothetical protein